MVEPIEEAGMDDFGDDLLPVDANHASANLNEDPSFPEETKYDPNEHDTEPTVFDPEKSGELVSSVN